MIDHLTGILKRKAPTEIVVDVNGVGYLLNISFSSFEKIGREGTEVTILTHLHVREDALQLYGFATAAEREMFRLLISVSGIGPRIAQSILSGVSSAELQNLVVQGNVGALTAIPGIGKKTAERLVVELRDKLAKIQTSSPVQGESLSQTSTRTEALMALMSLGHNRASAEKAIRAALQELDQKDPSVQELLKQALKASGR